jgi:hypothetical protein
MVLVTVVGWPLWMAASASSSSYAASVSLASQDGMELLSVEARAAPLQELLSEVARLAGFQIAGNVPIGRTVSVDFTRLPLDRALRRLLSGESFIFVHGQPTAGRSATLRLVILPETATSPQRDGSKVETLSEVPTLGLAQDVQTFDPDGPLEALLLLTAHQDPMMRSAAIEALSLHYGDERARRALIENISDPDPNIRSLALGLLGPIITRWPGAEDIVMMTSLQDPVAEVRQLALLTMWEASSPGLTGALRRALLDRDPGVRTRAESLFRRAPVEDPSD